MKTKHSPEISILLMSCALELTEEKRAQLTQFIDQHQLDWGRLYTLAARHRLTPFLFRTLQQLPNIPKLFLATLQQDCRVIVTGNLIKLHQYRLLAKMLTDNAIDHIPLKGAYLATNCYPESGLRIIGDLDVLVDKNDVFRTIGLLETEGFFLNQKYKSYSQYDEKVILADLYEVDLMKPFFDKNYFEVDLHWEVMCFNKHYKSFTLQEALSWPTMANEMQIILLIAHHGVVNIWQTISYINDLYFLVNERIIDWNWLTQELRRNGLEGVFWVGIHWCQQIWKLPLPASIEQMLETRNLQVLANAYELTWENCEPVPSSKLIIAQLTLFLKSQTKWKHRLRIIYTFCTIRMFCFSSFTIGKRVLYVPKYLGFVTFFIRSLRFVYRFAFTPR